jgi:hypothetical protein
MHRWDDEVFHQGKVAVLDDLMVPAFIDNDAANPTGDAAGLRQMTPAETVYATDSFHLLI